jgi:hypothetical protein
MCPSQDNSALRLTRRHVPTTLIPSRYFNEALSRAKLHPLHILYFTIRPLPLAGSQPIVSHHDWPVFTVTMKLLVSNKLRLFSSDDEGFEN